jgi:tellurite resistance protein TerC
VWTAIGLITGRPGRQPQEQPRLLSWLRRHVQPAGEDDGGHLIAWRGRRLVAGPMLLLILAIGVADVLFALDSIPAVFGITTSAYLIVACNAFALMGLRQVYVLLARVLDRIVYLNSGLAVICAFIGIKLLLQALHGSGVGWAAVVPAVRHLRPCHRFRDRTGRRFWAARTVRRAAAAHGRQRRPGDHPR